ncbi:MAG: hypothetical protein ACKOBV_06445, partial [Candidatus Kapaibacterium sp.]
MSRQPAYDDLLSRLEATRRKEIRIDLAGAVALSLFTVICAFLVLAGIEAFMHASSAARTVMMVVFFVGAVSMLGISVGRILWSRIISASAPTAFHVAQRVGDVFTDIRDRLLNAMQLATTSVVPGATSAELIDASFRQVVELTRDRDF